MIPDESEILDIIIRLLGERDPEADPIELRSKLDQPLDKVYKINSLIGVDIAAELTEMFGLPELPPTKMRRREYYVSIAGLLDYISKILKNSSLRR